MDTELKHNIGGGLRELPLDERDFSFGAVFGSVPLSELPHEFMVSSPLEIKDQGTTDMCTAFAAAAVSEDQELIVLGPEYLFAKTKQLIGEWTEWGASLRDVCKAITKFGCLPDAANSYKLGKYSRDFIADWGNWPSHLDRVANQFRKLSYFKVDGPYDIFDNIRAALWMNRNERQSILVGCIWEAEWTSAPEGVIPNEPGKELFGHAFKVFGWKTVTVYQSSDNSNYESKGDVIYLIAQLSNGRDVGSEGLFYFPLEVVNRKFKHGLYMFKDMDAETAKILLEKKWSRGWAWVAWFIKLWRWFVK